MNSDFVFVDEFVPGVRWDAKYATWDNFTGKPVDGYHANRIVGTRALCAALNRAQEEAFEDQIWGVPIYFFGKEKFWGQDRIWLFEQRLQDAGLALAAA